MLHSAFICLGSLPTVPPYSSICTYQTQLMLLVIPCASKPDLNQSTYCKPQPPLSDLQVAVHAIGDRAIDEVADVYARVARDNAALHASTAPVHGPPPRHRIEHAQHLSSPQAAERLAQLGILTTPNPPHLVADGDLMQRRLGATRAGAGLQYRCIAWLAHALPEGLPLCLVLVTSVATTIAWYVSCLVGTILACPTIRPPRLPLRTSYMSAAFDLVNPRDVCCCRLCACRTGPLVCFLHID